MANLNSWQKISRVLSGQPFGNGSDGDYSSATIPTLTLSSCSGSSGNSSLSLASTVLSNNDIVLIHQSRGSGVGQWEINRVVSGGGTNTVTLQESKQYTYTDSGASQAQVIVVPQYRNVIVQSGTWDIPDWNGNGYGILPFAAKELVTVTGTINGNSAGFRGGTSNSTDGAMGHQGEGTAGDRDTHNYIANGNGGGGGDDVFGSARYGGGGGGGGHATAGTAGQPGTSDGVPQQPGAGGNAEGSADLTDMVLGGSGGGGSSQGSASGAGGDGAGIVVIFANSFVSSSGAIILNGTNGAAAVDLAGGGGGGAGGSFLLACATATLGSNKISASSSSGGGGGKTGGAGAVGRIAVHHSGIVTGTTTPTFTDVQDSSLTETNAGFLGNFI